MTEADVILYIVIGTALAFDFTNGFHDTANVVATSISTRAMSPRVAVTYAAILNFVGAFISLEVAATVAADVVEGDAITPTIVFAGLVGAIVWNLATWYYGLPSSSSHALIGGRGRRDVRGGRLERDHRRWRDRQGARARGDRARRRVRGRCDRDRHLLPRGRPPAPRSGHAWLSPGPGRVRRDARARARHQRRSKDDGHHRARPDRQRQPSSPGPTRRRG